MEKFLSITTTYMSGSAETVLTVDKVQLTPMLNSFQELTVRKRLFSKPGKAQSLTSPNDISCLNDRLIDSVSGLRVTSTFKSGPEDTVQGLPDSLSHTSFSW